MKKYIVGAILSLTTLAGKAQATESWYGLVKFIDGFTDEVSIHVSNSRGY